MPAKLEDPFYYLNNFQTVLDWVGARHGALLDDGERAFVDGFPSLPKPARALLVRMVMRKGILFRAGKLRYAEIGPVEQAVAPLIQQGWVDGQPLIDIGQLFALLTKSEVVVLFGNRLEKSNLPKGELLEALRPDFPEPLTFEQWSGAGAEPLYALTVSAWCERLRLMFFGNLRQDWSEFVLAELGLVRYEKPELSTNTWAFRHRDDVDTYLGLQRCREQFEAGEALASVLEALPARVDDNPWLAARRAKLLYHIALHRERSGDFEDALSLYEQSGWTGARLRRVRVLERLERWQEALGLADAALADPENEAELQQLPRALPRLQRKLGLPVNARREPFQHARIDLELPVPDDFIGVEQSARDFLAGSETPVFYVENTLFNALFGLLCWPAIFAPLPGAFFHPFQSGPADLSHPDFYRRRADLFAACLAQLDSGEYRASVLKHFHQKFGLQSPFVFWEALSIELLELTLDCVPAQHLKKYFMRLLADIGANRSGLPDLIQFLPAQNSYRLIEVKGPGDRLQDNQRRWLDYCVLHEMPVAVCHVRWLA